MTSASAEPMVARCGLVCTYCGAMVKGKCQGCHSDKPMFRCCPVRKCVTERGFATCADCPDHANLRDCRKLNNFISKIFGLIFRSNRIGHLERIRAVGMAEFCKEACTARRH